MVPRVIMSRTLPLCPGSSAHADDSACSCRVVIPACACSTKVADSSWVCRQFWLSSARVRYRPVLRGAVDRCAGYSSGRHWIDVVMGIEFCVGLGSRSWIRYPRHVGVLRGSAQPDCATGSHATAMVGESWCTVALTYCGSCTSGLSGVLLPRSRGWEGVNGKAAISSLRVLA